MMLVCSFICVIATPLISLAYYHVPQLSMLMAICTCSSASFMKGSLIQNSLLEHMFAFQD
jgi:hypothetical protein